MTTYGPRQLSLAERLAAADAIVLVRTARLIESQIDELSERPREIGVFEVAISDVLDGTISDTARVWVVRDTEGAWPFAERGPQLALLQRGAGDRDWLLADGKAYRVVRGSFAFNHATDPRDRGGKRERVGVDDLKRLVDERRSRAKHDEAELLEREGRRIRARLRLPSEMPETNALADWLDVERGSGGREARLGLASEVKPPQRRTSGRAKKA